MTAAVTSHVCRPDVVGEPGYRPSEVRDAVAPWDARIWTAPLADPQYRAEVELERVADERVWTTEHHNDVVSVRDLYEQVARLRGELEPVTFDFPPDDAAVLAPPTTERTTL